MRTLVQARQPFWPAHWQVTSRAHASCYHTVGPEVNGKNTYFQYVLTPYLGVLHKRIRAILSCKLQGLDLRFFRSQIDERVVPVEVSYALLVRLGFNT